MQKISLFSSFLVLLFRGTIIWIIALIIFFGGIFAVASAQGVSAGGKFWEILNKILQTGNWQNPWDGTVKNSQKLWGMEAKDFQNISSVGQKCAAGKCMAGFDNSGNIVCN